MMKRIEVFRQLLARTPVDELEVRSHPRVIFRVDEITWIDAIVRYVVSPREAGSVKTRLIPKLLAALNAEPDKVMFPAGGEPLGIHWLCLVVNRSRSAKNCPSQYCIN